MGKSGAGKSSLCNALFQGEVTPVSDVHAGTREVRRFRLSGHGHSMIITDLPGVGESRDRDAEYEALYRDILPELDLVLWLIKADDRALSVDEYFWRHILHRGHQQVLFVVTQADKTEPCHEWDTVINEKGWQAVKSGAVATDTVVNTGAEGGPDAENGDTGQTVYGDAVRTTINKNGRQIVAVEGTANTTVVYAGGDQTVHGHALDTTLNGG